MIRMAVKEDLNKILDLYKFLFPDEDYTLNENYTHTWESILRNADVLRYFVCEEENKIICSACISVIPNLTRNNRPYAVIENVITHPDYRRKGYGRRLMQKCIDYAKSRNCYKIMLLSSAFRRDAHNFYKNLGFDSESKHGFQIRLI
jgi:GNAT superfamily N-acetyltransferase